MPADTDDYIFCCLEDFTASAEYENFSLTDFELDFVIRALSSSISSDPFKMLYALFQIIAVYYQSYIIHKRDSLEHRVSVF